MNNSTKTMSHEERFNRRRKIAAYCKNHTVYETAVHFAVSTALVRSACGEFRVKPKLVEAHSNMLPSTYDVIYDVLSGHSITATADKHNVTKQRVHQIATELRRAKITKLVKKKVR